jgi:hypothetical protein
MDSIKIDKLYPFKNIKGKYTSFAEPVQIEFPVSNVSYYTDSNLYIYANTFIHSFANDLKETLVKKVYNRGVYQGVSKETLSEFYVNPLKVIKLHDVFKVRIANQNFLKKGTPVKMNLKITGMWFGESSFGVYINVESLEVITIQSESHFINDSSDSEPEF